MGPVTWEGEERADTCARGNPSSSLPLSPSLRLINGVPVSGPYFTRDVGAGCGFLGGLLRIEPNVCVSGYKQAARHSGDSLLDLMRRL